jgi:hypothetical protein
VSTTRWSWLGAAVLAAIALIMLRMRATDDDPALAPATSEPGDKARTAAPRISQPPRPPGARTGFVPKIPEVVSHHLADPCSEVGEATIPTDFDELTMEGITIAWPRAGSEDPGPSDVALHPIALAHLVNGLLAEAAEVTGTSARTTLTVVIYTTGDDLRARTKAPAWANGLYDGAAVRVPMAGRSDMGVPMSTLRHEVMHAQLHAAVGCMPAWFNEGLAMYFAGTPPLSEWLALVRRPEALEVKTLSAPTIDEQRTEIVSRLYAQSLAMIMYLVERGGETGLRAAVQAAHTGEKGLWDRLAPGIDERMVIDVLARRIFGVARGPELDAVLANTICCYGLKSLVDLGCRGVPPRPGETIWTDRTNSPRATCSTRW